MVETINVAQINTWNKKENNLDVPTRERYERFFDAATQESALDIVGAQEVIEVKQFAEVAAEHGLLHYAVDSGKKDKAGVVNYVGVFSRFPVVLSEEVTLEGARCLFAVVNVNGLNVGVYSIHNSFGFDVEHHRLENLHRIMEHLKTKGMRGGDRMAYGEEMLGDSGATLDVALLTGDLNAEPDSDSIRYISGKHTYKGRSPLWVGRVHAPTSVPAENAFAAQIAAGKGMNPADTPNREIDYLLSYGWCYGKRGYPQYIQVIEPLSTAAGERLEYSDHLGIKSTIKL